MRHPQGHMPQGSQHWLQVMVSRSPDVFSAAFGLPGLGDIYWKSPLEDDDFAEYQDDDFLDLVGISLNKLPLREFWPRRGPVWDGLATSSGGKVLLIEAKANIPELKSPGTQASAKSARKIQASLDASKPSFGSPADSDWSHAYYQYANRLAHLYLLRAANGVDAHLVFLYFVHARDVSGPSSVEEWQDAIDEAHQALSLGHGQLTAYVHDVFVDVNDLSGP